MSEEELQSRAAGPDAAEEEAQAPFINISQSLFECIIHAAPVVFVKPEGGERMEDKQLNNGG